VLFRGFGWVCGVFFGFALGFLLVNSFSLFHFSIKLLITYKKKNFQLILNFLLMFGIFLSSLIIVKTCFINGTNAILKYILLNFRYLLHYFNKR
jgi:hypothetical protein